MKLKTKSYQRWFKNIQDFCFERLLSSYDFKVVNQPIEDFLGFNIPLGSTFLDLIHPDDSEMIQEVLFKLCLYDKNNSDYKISYRLRNLVEDRYFWVTERGTIFQENGNTYVSGVIEDGRAIEKLKRKAYIDFLTGAYSRLYFDEKKASLIFNWEENGRVISVMTIDIDHFKKINDTYGHDLGDRVLKEFSNLLLNIIRGGDKLIRVGGEEFLLLCGVKTERDINKLCERICDSVSTHNFPEVGKITCSVGATSKKNNESIEDTIKRSDVNLYHVKNNGRNGFKFD